MDPKEKEAAATAAAEAEAKARADKEKADAEAAKVKAEEEAEANKEHQIDYAAELAKEKAAREKAEKELADKRFKESEAKRKAAEAAGEDDTTRGVTSEDLDALENRIYQRAQKELQATRLTELAKELAQNDAEADLILEIHKNRTFPAHLTLDGQMQEAYAIANGRKLAAKNQELARALRSRDTASRGSGGTQHDSPSVEEPTLGSAEATALKDAGLVWDATRRAYKKPISGGKKFYYFDPKTKKRWTA